MVIQRWQSLFLFISAILVAAFCYIPVGCLTDEAGAIHIIRPDGYTPYLILNIATAVILFIAIFMFRNTRRQKLATLIAMLLILVSTATGVYFIITATQEVTTGSFNVGCLTLPAALVFAFMAYRRILADEKLLRSYDRLR
ncbi:MAG: DUF4293 domain-containing protein [Muribaculaceae bacterium]|nr:DUF4293 domain-containing protein [Muribaculaceae bacterium]